MKPIQEEKGSIIVEATLYMPLVLCTVMALIYLALFNVQEYMMMYQVQRVAAVTAREEAYLGYEEFDMGNDNEIDFSWGDGSTPSSDKVTAYYKAHHNSMRNLYREIGEALSAVGIIRSEGGNYSGKFADAAVKYSLVALGSLNAPEVKIDTGFLGTGVTVTITHSMPVPGVLTYLGYNGSTTVRAAAYTYSVNPSGFVRNVDLASDLAAYIFEKLGMSRSYNEFLSKTDEVLSKIL